MTQEMDKLKSKEANGAAAVRALTKMGLDPKLMKEYIITKFSSSDLNSKDIKSELENAIGGLKVSNCYDKFSFDSVKISDVQNASFNCIMNFSADGADIEIEMPIKITSRGNKPKVQIQLESRFFKMTICRDKQVGIDGTEQYIADNKKDLVDTLDRIINKFESTNFSQTIIPILENILAYNETLSADQQNEFEKVFLSDEVLYLLERSLWANENQELISETAREFFAYNFIAIIIRDLVNKIVINPNAIFIRFADILLDLNKVVDDEHFLSQLLEKSQGELSNQNEALKDNILTLRILNISILSSSNILGLLLSVIYKQGSSNAKIENILTSLTLLYKKYEICGGVNNLPFDPDFWKFCISKSWKLSGVNKYPEIVNYLKDSASKDHIGSVIDIVSYIIRPEFIENEQDTTADILQTEDIVSNEFLENDEDFVPALKGEGNEITQLSRWDLLVNKISKEKVKFTVKPKNANRMVVSINLKKILYILDLFKENNWDPFTIIQDKRATTSGINFEQYKGSRNIFTARISQQHRLQIKLTKGMIEIFGVSGHPERL